MTQREVYFEMRRVGNYVRVVAVDAPTGVEVTVVGDAKAGAEQLKKTALRKLDYVLAKKNGG